MVEARLTKAQYKTANLVYSHRQSIGKSTSEGAVCYQFVSSSARLRVMLGISCKMGNRGYDMAVDENTSNFPAIAAGLASIYTTTVLYIGSSDVG